MRRGPSFSEEISRSVIQAVWHDADENPHEAEVRVAAALTMFEAFHPRDHLECMLAAQGVAAHAMIMECYRRAMLTETAEAIAIKLRSNVSQLSRTFSVLLHDLERRQSKPLMQRPPAPPAAEPPSDEPPSAGPPSGGQPPGAIQQSDRSNCLASLDDVPERPEDVELRPDGTPGSLTAYAPKPPPQAVYIPREAAIMVALATRPKPWRMVNAANDAGTGAEARADVPEPEPERSFQRGPLNLREAMFNGDALSRFASARLDPDAPRPPSDFDEEDSVVELELISTGGDPEAEARRAAMIAAHPEGKPIVTFRYSEGRRPPRDTPEDTEEEA
jgi:hypothetical protein